MPRLAWFTPLPPTQSGIAAYSAELLPLLGRDLDIDVYRDPKAPAPTVDLKRPVFPSHDFVWHNFRQPYDLTVYQLGNSPAHDYMWPYLVRYPGLVALHDAQLHHSRARALLARGRQQDYRAEFAFCHPDANPTVADSVIASLAGTLFYVWPLVRVPMEASRLVVVHGSGLARLLAEQYPGVDSIEMGVADPGISAEAGARVRARHGVASDAVVFAAYGVLTPEKRLPQILRALPDVLRYVPAAHLLLVGAPVDHYDVMADARTLGVADHVTVTGYVRDEDLPDYLNAADVCLSLRWPTSRETSAAWLRCLAAGKPTIITDLAHNALVPSLDPRTWMPTEPRLADRGAAGEQPPACVAIDILDEQHSLGLAMLRLAGDQALRAMLARRARQYWSVNHTPERMAADYRRAIATAMSRPVPDRTHLPAHLLGDGSELARRLLCDFGVRMEEIGFA